MERVMKRQSDNRQMTTWVTWEDLEKKADVHRNATVLRIPFIVEI